MEFEELRTYIGNELKRRFWEHKAMPALSRNRAGLDGWLKVELAAMLCEKFPDAAPGYKLPKGRAAVRAGGWLVDAVSLPTDFKFDDTQPGPGRLENDVRALRKLIKRLRKGKGQDRAAVFLAVYPFGDLHDAQWKQHKAKIEKALGGALVEDRFSFQSGVTGRLYAGLVREKIKPQPQVQAVARPVAQPKAIAKRRAVAVA